MSEGYNMPFLDYLKMTSFDPFRGDYTQVLFPYKLGTIQNIYFMLNGKA